MTVLLRAAGLAGYKNLAQSLGIDANRELKRAGLSPECLEDPDALISYTAVMRLLERSALVGRCPDFGLRLSEMQGIEVLGPLAVLIRHAATLGEALQLVADYIFVHSPGIRESITPVDGIPTQVDLEFEIDVPHRPPCAQTIELSLGLGLKILRLLVPNGLNPVSARLPHAKVGPLAAYQRSLGCPCTFEAETAAVRISVADLQRPLEGHNRLVREMAQAYLNQHFGERKRLLTDRVRALVRGSLGAGPLTQLAIADDLSIHSRTLQRRLMEEGNTFEGIVDDARRERLTELLQQPSPPSLTQVAMLLGYSEQAALTRSCRRWFACTPTELRRRYRQSGL